MEDYHHHHHHHLVGVEGNGARPDLALLYGAGLSVCLYVFYLVTDYRLVPSIRVVCDRLHVPDDVAGSTLLGASLNAPELFTSAVSAFTGGASSNGVGVGLVMGSFNFNIFLITGITALVARKKLRSRQLRVEWIFLQRDVYFYALAVVLLVVFCGDARLEWWECLTMALVYLCYVVVCLLTGRLTRFLCPTRAYKPRRRRSALIQVTERGEFDVTIFPKNLEKTKTFSKSDLNAEEIVESLKGETAYRLGLPVSLESLRVQNAPPHEVILTRSQQLSAKASSGGEVVEPSEAGRSWSSAPTLAADEATPLLGASPYANLTRAFSNPMTVKEIDFGRRLTKEERMEVIHVVSNPEAPSKINVDMRLVNCAHDEMSKGQPWATDVLQIAENIELEEEAEAYHSQHLLAWPKYGSPGEKAVYLLKFPLNALITLTIPSGQDLYPLSILLSILWLGATSFLLSLCSVRFGRALLIPDSVVGLTIDSIGTSLPNLLAAVVAGRSGRSETAICQAFGSNTFDALVAFGLVQFIKSATTGFEPIGLLSAGGVERDSIIDLVLLFLYVWFFYFFRFRLTRGFGWICICLYAGWLGYQLFLVYSSGK
ncbi:sodium/potassium/calcium exchanger protein [Chloropicon primus]|uniref:Sodium/potassium/calcium exchanger protein n=1 Tax=Chloropicon primus TaxID=1764295 RepID=A0A5B8MNA5_9CHLO|nr:sodium/potassium/calcium exchanger protein [Chloropicon primus]UPR00735.1 sodium/potassium/calcium exchanger protein [Chloropicon primus]|mmetsp:Transcript_3219/g.8914  ORF Transcript_3219/g.8914 Transcript_3219/m.8914 type:complete len:599 (+) Transcript_3219:109-1905(+)|eukprot:QDZ21524.1 sodium/potassium/calcium exchanger protein [Chloropicon primus]